MNDKYLKEYLDEINTNLIQINLRLLSIENTLGSINKSTHNMDEHIYFVEHIFDVVKTPFINILKWYNKDISNDINNDINKLIKDKQS
jgi:hypothetical protein